MFSATLMDVAALAMTAFSPSKTCRVRVSSTRYRHDPYRARVVPSLVKSPAKITAAVAAASIAAPRMAAASAVEHLPVIPRAMMAAPVNPVTAPAVVPMTAASVVAASKPAVVEAAAAKPVTSKLAAPQLHFALVGFKHETSMYQAPFRVSAGDIVIVEADRGEHIGIVQSVVTVAPKYNVPCRILRRANTTEAEQIDELTAKEKKTTVIVQKLAESLGLGIRIVDTEFQMDQNKMTVFFSSKVFVDFRKLQRSLFRDFRCRIWLVNWAEVRPYTPVPVNPVC
jgi:hypothetical protein